MLPPEQGQGPWKLMAGLAGPCEAYPVFGRRGGAARGWGVCDQRVHPGLAVVKCFAGAAAACVSITGKVTLCV